ncbi:unnamed protein product [Amoebophrya sp. A120]|nr:unnamed protein product [Amoebophrya sp. A120]|eukprot:GSA120T00013703001.1
MFGPAPPYPPANGQHHMIGGTKKVYSAVDLLKSNDELLAEQNREEDAYKASVWDRILKNKKRSLQLFGPENIDPEPLDTVDVPKWKALKLDFKRSNEYGLIEEKVGVRRGGAGIPAMQASLTAIEGPAGMLALEFGGATASSRNIDQKTTRVIAPDAKTSETALAMLPQPVNTVANGPSSNSNQQQLSLAHQMGGNEAGPAKPQTTPDESTKQANKIVHDSQVQLSIYREGDQIINLENPDQRLRALEKPQWHRPWKLHKVLAGHTGWVRCVAVDPSNEWFCTSGQDRLIKFWDLATGTLKLTLTGHSSCVRALEISKHHPYFYSGGEDNEVRCWDLNTNKIIRTYHGHLQAVYSLKLHPTLDILASGGRDGTVRIWDIRSRSQIFALTHEAAVHCLASQAAEPQFISGSADNTVKLWDLAAGKSMAVLTNHKKSIRAVAIHPKEYTFVSCSNAQNKVWRCPKGVFERDIYGHDSIINACAIRENEDGSSILVGGGDDGFLHFWDWKTGYLFQSIEGKPQPGSLSSENAIFGMAFDQSQTRLITAECDKTVKIYKQDFDADEKSHPIGNWRGFLSKNRKR